MTFSINLGHIRKCINVSDFTGHLNPIYKIGFRCNYHSLSTKIVPARTESTPMAPEILVMMTSKMNIVGLLDFKSGYASKPITVTPAIAKDKFCVRSQSWRTCKHGET